MSNTHFGRKGLFSCANIGAYAAAEEQKRQNILRLPKIRGNPKLCVTGAGWHEVACLESEYCTAPPRGKIKAMSSAKTITSVATLLEVLPPVDAGRDFLHHLRHWYRGQAVKDWPLHPSVYRPGFSDRAEEKPRLHKESQLFWEFQIQSAGLLSGTESNEMLYFLQQHYRLPTRLLDWSMHPLAALFFAISEPEHEKEDGEFFMMKVYELATDQKACVYNEDTKRFDGGPFKGIATSRHRTFMKALSPITSWEWKHNSPHFGFPSFIIPVRPDHFDRRMSLQRSCFTFHVPRRKVLDKDANKSLESFIVPKDAKAAIRVELFRLGVDHFSVYGDLENLCRKLKFAFGV